MRQYCLRRVVVVSLLGGMFVLGFVSGSVSQRSAQAQVPGAGKGMLKQATGAGGAVGSVAELGSSVVEMQQHVDGLQKKSGHAQKSASRAWGQQIRARPWQPQDTEI
jgi:hypothetical protein